MTPGSATFALARSTDNGPEATFVDMLRRNASHTERAHVFIHNDQTERRISFDRLWALACRHAARFLELGLRKGDRLGLVVPEPDAFVLAFCGAMIAGIVPVPMYPPLSLSKRSTYRHTLEHILRFSGASAVLMPASLKDALEAAQTSDGSRDVRLLTEGNLENLPSSTEFQSDVSLDDVAFLQFTSGSTRAPKGVEVTHRNLRANSIAIVEQGLRGTPSDRAMTWLPLYHDMGLIGFVIAPAFSCTEVMYMGTLNFVRRPAVWLEAIHRFRATTTFAPNFAFALTTRSVSENEKRSWDLSCLRVIGCGAEPIQPEVLRSFAQRFASCGLAPEALLPCYGLAEATLAVTFCDLGGGVRTDCVSSNGIEHREARPLPAGRRTERAREFVSCGRPVAGVELRIVDESGRPLPERMVGEVTVRGPSVSRGYVGDADATAAAFIDGWLHTGDLGYLADGELYVCGRIKDLIILNGKNHYPQDIEQIASQALSVRPDQCVAFPQVDAIGTEKCVLVSEAPKDRRDLGGLGRAVRRTVSLELGLALADVVFIKPRTLPRTSSGKVRRRETKQRLERGAFEVIFANRMADRSHGDAAVPTLSGS